MASPVQVMAARLTQGAAETTNIPRLKPSNPTQLRYMTTLLKPGAVTQKRYEDALSHNVDVAVIGSGPGGLTSAALLSKAGYRCAVFEQHDQLGGTLHTFVEEDKWEFDTGLHYVGYNLAFSRFLHYATGGRLGWSKLSPVYDIATGPAKSGDGTESVKFQQDMKVNVDELCRLYPEEEAAIRRYYTDCLRSPLTLVVFVAYKAAPVLAAFLRPGLFALAVATVVMFPDGMVGSITAALILGLALVLPAMLQKLAGVLWHRISQVTTADYMKKCGLSDRLAGIFTYQFYDYGTRPSVSPFFLQGLHIDHWRHGAFYPRGGPSKIAEELTRTITDAGGCCFVRSPVEEVLIGMKDGGMAAVGVRVNGFNIRAPIVISGVGATCLAQRLLPQGALEMVDETTKAKTSIPLPPRLRQLQIATAPPHSSGLRASATGFTLFLGIKGTSEERQIPSNNLWAFHSWDHEANKEKVSKCESPEDLEFTTSFIAFPSAKDDSWEKRWPGRSVCEVIVPCDHAMFERWDGTRLHARGAEYDEMKEKISQRIMNEVVFRYYPQLKGHVEFYTLGTSQTNNFYYGTAGGEIYGLDHTAERFSSANQDLLMPQTDMPGLYMTGQDVAICGVLGGVYAGILTAATVAPGKFLSTMVPGWIFSARGMAL